MSEEKVIEIENLSFTYTGGRPYILEELNLSIKKGEYVSVVGDNGSGKSTLMRLLLGFLSPTAGRLHVAAHNIGYVPQRLDVSNTAFPITVFEALDSYRRLIKLRDKKKVDLVLDQVGMSDFKKEMMGNLSGGQCQKILIARAIMGEPGLLILDEPSTGVDVAGQQEIYRLIKRLNVETGMTILSVEHNLDAAIENSTLIYHLIDGRGHLCSPKKYAREVLKGSDE